MKQVNVTTANEFHDWQRENLPRELVIQDIDSWAVVASEAHGFQARAILELKRSYMEPEQWEPFAADRNNYASLISLSRAAGIPFYVVYWKKGSPIRPETVFRLIEMTQAFPEYYGQHYLTTAEAFADFMKGLT